MHPKQAPLKHLVRMTTQIGLIQHSISDVPDLKRGYSIDDNARALIVCLLFQKKYQTPFYSDYIKIYFSYIKKALTKNGFFHNFMDENGNFTDEFGSEDSFGRTVWALCSLIAQKDYNSALSMEAKKIFDRVSVNFPKIKALRARSFLILGLSLLGEKSLTHKLADQLVQLYQDESDLSWNWFEDELTYSNAIIPYSLFQSYLVTKNQKHLEVGLASLDFLVKTCHISGIPAPIGQNGWHKKNGEKSLFDQQLIDVADMVLASEVAFKATKDPKYLKEVRRWFSWFSGHNINSLSLFNPKTEGCFDALTKAGVNQNQGAESIIAYLLSYNSVLEITSDF